MIAFLRKLFGSGRFEPRWVVHHFLQFGTYSGYFEVHDLGRVISTRAPCGISCKRTGNTCANTRIEWPVSVAITADAVRPYGRLSLDDGTLVMEAAILHTLREGDSLTASGHGPK